MKYLLLLASFIAVISKGLAQAEFDSLFTNKGIRVVSIKEVTPDLIKYTFPGEELVNSITKSEVYRIKHKSGREELITRNSPLNVVKGYTDFNKVVITSFENEIQGLFMIRKIESRGPIADVAFKRMKIEAAMVGGNIVFVNHQVKQSPAKGARHQEFSGTVYTNKVLDVKEFEKIVINHTKGYYLKYYHIFNEAQKVSETDMVEYYNDNKKKIQLIDIRYNHDSIEIKTSIEVNTYFKVIYFDEDQLVLMNEVNRTLSNYVLNKF